MLDWGLPAPPRFCLPGWLAVLPRRGQSDCCDVFVVGKGIRNRFGGGNAGGWGLSFFFPCVVLISVDWVLFVVRFFDLFSSCDVMFEEVKRGACDTYCVGGTF